MRWKGRRKSTNIEDRRGQGGGGGRMRMPMGRKGGIGGIGLIIAVVAALYFGIDPTVLIQGMGGGGPSPGFQPGQPRQITKEDRELGEFIGVVLADTEDVWHDLFKTQLNGTYQEPKLVLFSGFVQSACGMAQSAMGPFYCPGDRKVYIDLSFYRDLRDRFRAPGDFAQAYVIAHEVGHHVQTLLGISQKVHEARGRVGQREYNKLSVRLELQADCFSGVWANRADKARNILEKGDIEEALNAASAIGDDRIQKQTTGRVTPDSFTHGSAEQRVRWFKVGLESGDLRSCDTFNARRL